MAVLTVPRPLQERLGDAATDSLLGMFGQVQADQQQQREAHQEQLFELLEERFLRHVAESETRLRKEMGESEIRLRKEMGESEIRLRNEMNESETRLRNEMQAGFGRQQEQLARQQDQLVRQQEQIAGLGRQIGNVHQQIAVQTRWILMVLGGAVVLFPIIQRIMAALLP